MKKKTAIITGVTGQDGSYLAKLLIKKDIKVYGIIRRTSSDPFYRLKYLNIDTARKSLKHSRKQSHLHLKMRKQSILLTSETKVRISKSKSVRLMVIGIMTNLNSMQLHH